jgi:hypothetical protein
MYNLYRATDIQKHLEVKARLRCILAATAKPFPEVIQMSYKRLSLIERHYIEIELKKKVSHTPNAQKTCILKTQSLVKSARITARKYTSTSRLIVSFINKMSKKYSACCFLLTFSA